MIIIKLLKNKEQEVTHYTSKVFLLSYCTGICREQNVEAEFGDYLISAA
jgi:hypothetical protein